MSFTKLVQSEETVQWAKDLVAFLSPYPYAADIVFVLIAFVTGAAISLLVYFLLERLLVRYINRFCTLEPKMLYCVRGMASSLVSCVPIYMVAYSVWVDGIHEWIATILCELMEGLIVIAIALTITYGIRIFGLWYKQQRNAAQRPIDGLLRVSMAFVWAGAVILCFSVMLNRSPLYLLSGLGAIAAVLMLVFQQSLLSLVASVQVNADQLVEIGDWIATDGGVDGSVEEITLHTVKVRNWDKSLVCLPICDLVKKPFVNFSAMQRTGGRRIKFAIPVDQRSIRFLTREEVRKLKGIDLLKDYLCGKEEEIDQYNSGRTTFNARHLTNLGTFRVYAHHFLARNRHVRGDMLLTVRELDPTTTGVPLEIYCFSNEVDWVPFEKVKSDIIEHLLAVMPNFRLRAFQDCSDIHQELGNQVDMVGGAFHFEQQKRPSAGADVI